MSFRSFSSLKSFVLYYLALAALRLRSIILFQPSAVRILLTEDVFTERFAAGFFVLREIVLATGFLNFTTLFLTTFFAVGRFAALAAGLLLNLIDLVFTTLEDFVLFLTVFFLVTIGYLLNDELPQNDLFNFHAKCQLCSGK